VSLEMTAFITKIFERTLNMSKQLTDEEINLRRIFRRRLIGAAALMLAVVVVLPMVLDSEPKVTGQDIELRIPAPDKVGEFVPGAATEEVSIANMSGVASSVDVLPEASVPLSEAKQVTTQGVIKTPAVVKPAIAAVAQKAPPMTTVKPVVDEAKKPVVHEVIEAKATPTNTSSPEVTAAPAPHIATSVAPLLSAGQVVVQVGAYSNAQAAEQQLTQLKGWHFKAYTEQVGDKIRVRVGPYDNREKADLVRGMLEQHGLHPVVTGAK
jgi:DedD protein